MCVIEKIIVHEGEGRGNDRRQRIDIYLNFISAFEVPAHIVTPMEAEEQQLAHNRAWQKEWREKRKATEPPKPRQKSLKELAQMQREGLDLTPEEQERLDAYRKRKAESVKKCQDKQKAERPRKRTLKELAKLQKPGADLMPEEAQRLEVHQSRKKIARQDLAEPAAAKELAEQRAYGSDNPGANAHVR